MLKLMREHIKGYERQAVLSPILIILEVICELTLPLIMAQIVDVAIPAGDVRYIFLLGAGMVALALASMACGVGAAKAAAFASQGFGCNLRQSIFDKIQTFSFADIDRFSSASLITRITNDVNVLTMMLAMGLRMLIRAPMMLVTALVVSIVLNAKLAMVLVVVIPVMTVIIAVVMNICTKLFKRLQTKIDHLNSTLQENLVGVRVVKAFVRENHERKKFKSANDELTEAGLDVGLRIVTIMPIMMLCMNGAMVAVLYFGGQMVMGGAFDLGRLQAFLGYIMQILMSVMMVAMTLLQLSRSQACAQRIREVLDATPDIQDGENAADAKLPAPKGKVEFHKVSFKYAASNTGDDVLKDIDLTVEPGQFVAIVGGTGVGKSSLVNLIPRFYDPTGGQILLDGMDVRDYPLDDLRRRIGMVLQNNVLFTGTVRENLLWGKPDATQEELERAAQDAQAFGFIMSLPQGFDTLLDQGGVNLSGGQKQRLCIARAMLKQPAVLILDDSTSAVDSSTEAAIRKSFHENLKGTTVIMIAQRISSVQYADQIVILDDDHIAGQGTHEELLASNPIYQEIYQSQQEGVME